MKGYKVFNKDWTCRGFQYEVGKKWTTWTHLITVPTVGRN